VEGDLPTTPAVTTIERRRRETRSLVGKEVRNNETHHLVGYGSTAHDGYAGGPCGVDATAQTDAVTGVIARLTVPGSGAVLLDVGRIVTNLETDEVTFQAGPHQLVEGDLADLCEALAPPE
jgi:hypothetical protein